MYSYSYLEFNITCTSIREYYNAPWTLHRYSNRGHAYWISGWIVIPILSSATRGSGTACYFHANVRATSQHTSEGPRTFGSCTLCRDPNIRVNEVGRYPDQYFCTIVEPFRPPPPSPRNGVSPPLINEWCSWRQLCAELNIIDNPSIIDVHFQSQPPRSVELHYTPLT